MLGEPIPDVPETASDAGTPAEDFTPESASQQIEEELVKLRDDNKKLTEQLLRKQAEVENFRKRAEREKDEFMQYSLFSAVKELLPILDGFELALNSDGGGEEYRKGVALIYQKLSLALEKLGLKPIECKGQEFDPHKHQAVATVETDEVPEHGVVEELQRGYFFKDRLLRPAMVTVAKRRN
ncbi:MAG: nucleotide exchange factor GrpE [Acidobacteria bacterium]|nr:nucleotide exchange factor GrpE [Acidobacteriota bacterium]